MLKYWLPTVQQPHCNANYYIKCTAVLNIYTMWFNESTYPELLLVRQTKSKAKTKAMGPEDKDIKFSLEEPRGQGLASGTT